METLNLSKNRIVAIELSVGKQLQFIETLDLSYNRIESLACFEDYFPNLTVVNISHNELLVSSELEFMIYLETIAEIDLDGNDFFSPGTEDEVRDKYPFLERINKRIFRVPGDREIRAREEIFMNMLSDGLITPEEIQLVKRELW